MKATDFDTTFDVDVPVWMMEQLDREAQRLGVTLQSVIKFWLSERLEVIHKRRGTEITSSR